MRLIHYMDLNVNPYTGINPGKSVFNPMTQGVFCVPDPTNAYRWYEFLHHFWANAGNHAPRDLRVTLEVPDEFLFLCRMGDIEEFPSDTVRNRLNVLCKFCEDDDNGIIIRADMQFNPAWIVKTEHVFRDNNNQFVAEEIDESFWGSSIHGPVLA